MPVLIGTQDKTKKVFLPSYAGTENPAWIEIYENLALADLAGFVAAMGTESQNRMLQLICKIIKDWNFTDSDGKKLPISIEYVSKLNASDMGEVISQVEEIVTQFANAKKKSMSLPKPTA